MSTSTRSALLFVLLVALFHLALHISQVSSAPNLHLSPYVSDVCDWQGSGSPSGTVSDRSVVPIYLRCSAGTVRWLYPKTSSGLRVILKLGSNKNFRGCIRVARNSSRSVRIYLEGKRQLHQIYSFDDGKHADLMRCFVSVHSFMALFVETEPGSGKAHHSEEHVEFSYDLQATTNTSALEEDMSHCKSCSEEQMLSRFCSADFVLAAKVNIFHHRPEVDLTEFTVKPTFVYRFPVDSSYVNDFNASSYSALDSANSIEDPMPFSHLLTLHRPLKCAARAESRTEYLFLGRKMLGNYLITCATKLSYWKHISAKALEAGTNQCHIS